MDLIEATIHGDLTTIQSLIEQSNNTDIINKLLIYACMYYKESLVKYLIENGADPNYRCYAGFTALYYACITEQLDIVKYLLKHGANINNTNNQGKTPLHFMYIRENLEMIKFLIDNGANPNHQDINGFTILHDITRVGYIEIVKYLIENGANPLIKSNTFFGETPLDTLIQNKKEIIEYYGTILDLNTVECKNHFIQNEIKEYLKQKSTKVIQKHSENWLWKPICKDLTLGINLRKEINKF